MEISRYPTPTVGTRVALSRTKPRSQVAVGVWGFALLLAYVSIEFVRPQYLAPAFAVVRPAMVLSILITLYWIRTWGIKELVGDKLLWLFLLFTAEAVIWIPFAVNNFWAAQASKTLVLLILASAVPLGLMLVPANRRDQFFMFWILVHVYLAFYSLANGGRGPGSFLEDQNDLALALCMGVPYPYFVAQRRGARIGARLLCYLAIVTIVAGIIWTNSRGGFIGLVCVAAYMFWLTRNKIRNLFLIALLGICILQLVPDTYFDRVGTISNTEDGSRNERLLSWRISWEIFLDNPVVGVGPQNWPFRAGIYQVVLPDYQPGDKLLAGRVAHSLWFTLIPEFGTVGTVLFIMIVIGLLRRLRSLEHNLRPFAETGDTQADKDLLLSQAIRASIIGYLSAGTFITVLYHPQIWYIVGFVIALSRDVDARTSAHSRTAST